MNSEQLKLLKEKLAETFVPALPPLLNTSEPEEKQQAKNVSRALSAFVLHKVVNVDVRTASESVVDDFDDNGLDAIFYDQLSERLYLIQSKLKEGEQFQIAEVNAFTKGVKDLLNQHYDRFNENVVNRSAELDDALDNAIEIKLVVAYASTVSLHAKNALNQFLSDFQTEDERLSETWIDYGPDQIIEDFLHEQAIKTVDADVVIVGDHKIENPVKTYYGQVSVESLAKLYDDHENALLERNIRYFLGTGKSSVNRGIKATMSEEPDQFFFLNNGVTAVGKTITPKGKKDGGRRFKVEGLSVINGAQTIASAAEHIKENPEQDVSSAMVMITLIEVGDADSFGVQVTKARNHQNSVSSSQFAALDETQERLRRELAMVGITYRYRPEAPATSDGDSMDIRETGMALALFSTNPNYPAFVKGDSSKFLAPSAGEYQGVFNGQVSGKKIVNAVRLYRAAMGVLHASEGSSLGQTKLIYRHGKFAIAWLAFNANRNWLELETIADDSAAKALLSASLDDWREKVRSEVKDELSRTYKGPLAFFRNVTTSRPFVQRLHAAGL